IGSYYGSEIAPMDIDGDGITDNPVGGSAHVLQWRAGERKGLHLQTDRTGE
ncbi:unnamed protein product, partial [Tetraodon nigroviridis]